MAKSGRSAVTAALSLVLLAGIIFIMNQSFEGSVELPDPEDIPDEIYLNKPVRIPEEVTFAGERMPLENFDTRESLERELLISSYRHSSTILIIKRANRYLPIIEKILHEYNVPDDFKYLVAAESEYSNMVSPARATGFWQIMAATGREDGMEINDVVDERYHLGKSTEFACRYLLKSYEKYGNWTLAAASYNGGRAAVDNQLRIQKEDNYYNLLLAEETARYIFRVVAYKLVINDPKSYGFNIEEKDLYPELDYYEVKVDTTVNDLAAFAKSFGTNYKMLKFLNPWLRKPYLTPRHNKEYLIKIPAEDMRTNNRAGLLNQMNEG